jgi:hypothetical protein
MSLKETINIRWSFEDVLSIRDDLTKDQACEVLAEADHRHDAEIGINWFVLEIHADHLYPRSR